MRHQGGWSSCPALPPGPGRSRTGSTGGAEGGGEKRGGVRQNDHSSIQNGIKKRLSDKKNRFKIFHYLVLLQSDLCLLEAHHQLSVFCPDVALLCHLFDLF